MTKTSFLALCVAALTPCYLLAGGGKDGDESEKPTRSVAAPIQNLSDSDGLPSYDASASLSYLVATANAAAATDEALARTLQASKLGSDGGSDDEETLELEKQVNDQARATRLAAKKRALSEKLAALKIQEDADIIAATQALETNSDDAQTKAAVVDARRQEIAHAEDDLAVANGSQGSSAEPSWEQRQRTKFSDEWSRQKAERQAAGKSDFSTGQKIEKETQRVVMQVNEFLRKPFGKKKK